MFCSKCGKEIEDDAVFCPQCGCKIRNANNEPVINTEKIQNILKSGLNTAINYSEKATAEINKKLESNLNRLNTDSNNNVEQDSKIEPSNSVENESDSLSKNISKGFVLIKDNCKAVQQKETENVQKTIQTLKEEHEQKSSEKEMKREQKSVEKEAKREEKSIEREKNRIAKEQQTKERIEKEKEKKMEVSIIVAFIPTVLGFAVPFLSIIGIVLFAYGIWHAKRYEKKGVALGVIGIIIAILTGITGYYILSIVLPIINSASAAINTVSDVATSVKGVADNAANVLDDIGGMANSFDDLIQSIKQFFAE